MHDLYVMGGDTLENSPLECDDGNWNDLVLCIIIFCIPTKEVKNINCSSFNVERGTRSYVDNVI